MRVQAQRREVPHHDGLEVHHEVASERRVLEPRQEEQPWRLDGAAGHDHQVGRHGVGLAGRVDVLDPGRPPSLDEDPADAGLGHQLQTAGRHGPGQQGHRVALGVDGAAEERAVAAVVAGGPAVVGDAVRRGRRFVGMQAHLLRRGRRQQRAVHGRTRGHRVGTAAPGGERVRALAARHADGPLDLGVVRLELVVLERPVVDVGALLRAAGRAQVKVLFPEAGHLAVGVHAAAADGGRDGVDLAHVCVLAVGRRDPEGPWLDERIGPEEIARDELDLVVGIVATRLGHVVGIEQVVAPLLQHAHGPTGPGEHLGRGGAARTRTDDEGLVRHACDTSASL